MLKTLKKQKKRLKTDIHSQTKKERVSKKQKVGEGDLQDELERYIKNRRRKSPLWNS